MGIFCLEQQIINIEDNYNVLDDYFKSNNITNFLLVCDSAMKFLKISDYFKNLTERTEINFISFSDFEPNPKYESVVKGVELFLKEKCQAVVAVGGGSSIDVAKCIKLYSNMNPGENYLKQKIVPNDISLLAIPTTAGTGSEATRFAVIYYEGNKQSVTDLSIIPSTVVFDPSCLETLPLYQKKSTMLDALCHAIESFWSVNSTEESKEYSKKAIELILKNEKGYLDNLKSSLINMLVAANLAGKAINITQTTAGHAMSYKIVSLYHISHGHSVAICLPKIWRYMINHTCDCIDSRGEKYLDSIFDEIATAFGVRSKLEAVEKFEKLLNNFELKIPEMNNYKELEILSDSVNPVRLKNNPVKLSKETLTSLYKEIFNLN